MKKTTIALLTAAAMGTSGAAMAATHGPEFSGRIDLHYLNVSGDDSNGELSNRSSKLEVSGSGDGLHGITTFYYTRLSLNEVDDDETSFNVDYVLAGASGDFGSVQAGIDDDLVYKFAGAHTDIYRGLGTVSSAYYSDGFEFGDAESASLQYSVSVDALTFAAYADTSEGDGVERYQAAIGFDAGMGQVGLIFSDRDEEGDSNQFVFGGRLDLDVVSLRGHVSDDEDGNNPYAVAAIVPLNDILSLTVGYGDDDEGDSSTAAMLLADLGGGLDVNAGYRNGSGEVDDAFNIGMRYSF